MKISIGAFAFILALAGPAFAQGPSGTDLWDISLSTAILNHSNFDAADGRPGPYDPRDIFGGQFSNYTPERGNVVFDDLVQPSHVHFVEWRTATPVTIDTVRLFAVGDIYGREFETFTLKAKSAGSSAFDLAVFDYVPTHPYTFVDQSTFLVFTATISSLTAQDWRAEFLNRSNQSLSGPRIIEMDAFHFVPEPGSLVLAAFSLAVLVFRTARCWGRKGRTALEK